MLTTGRSVRGRAIATMVLGTLLTLAGIATYIVTSLKLSALKITVPQNAYGGLASAFSERRVNNPFALLGQIDVVNHHVMEATGGRTFAEIPFGDPARDTAQTGNFTVGTLTVPLIAYAVAALIFFLGILFIIVGSALNHLSDRFDGLGNALASGGYGSNREGVVLDPGLSYTTPASTYVEESTVEYGSPTT